MINQVKVAGVPVEQTGSWAVSFTSDSVNVEDSQKYGFQVNFSGGTGTFTVEATLDDVSWLPVTSPTALTLDNSAGSPAQLVEVQPAWRKVRLVWTRASGTMTVTKATSMVVVR